MPEATVACPARMHVPEGATGMGKTCNAHNSTDEKKACNALKSTDEASDASYWRHRRGLVFALKRRGSAGDPEGIRGDPWPEQGIRLF